MSEAEAQAAELAAAVYGLTEIRRLVSEGRESFESSADRRRALALCWVSVGSALKHYTSVSGAEPGRTPLSAPIRFRDRLAHQRLDKLDADLLWETSVRETPVLLRFVELLVGQLRSP